MALKLLSASVNIIVIYPDSANHRYDQPSVVQGLDGADDFIRKPEVDELLARVRAPPA